MKGLERVLKLKKEWVEVVLDDGKREVWVKEVMELYWMR